MPSAHAILWFLGVFVGLWALSLAVRGMVGDRSRGRRRCPACFASVAPGTRSCGACGYEARSERALQAPRRDWRMVAAGVVLAPLGALACYFGVKVWAWTHLSHDVTLTLTFWDSTAVALAVFGAVAIGWAIRGERSRGRRRCPGCWYDMTGSGLKCPECGHEARHVSQLYRARRRWKAAALASLLLLGAAAVQGVPRVRQGGWRAAFPSTVLIAGLPWLPDALAFDPDPKAEEDWTLLARFESERLWGWQSKWLVQRARGVLGHARTARDVQRSLHFAGLPPKKDASRKALVICLRALSAGSPPERDAAVRCLGEIAQVYRRQTPAAAELVRPMLPDLMRILGDNRAAPDVVWTAAWAVSLVGPQAEPAVMPMLQIGARGGRLRLQGLVAFLRNLAVSVPPIRARVVAALDDPDPGVVDAACWTLGHPSLCDDATAQRLLRLVREGDDARAAAAGAALCRAMWTPQVVIPAMLDQLASARTARAGFADPLWIYECQLLPYFPSLGEFLGDPDPQVRSAVINAVAACERDGRFHLRNSALYPLLDAMKDDPDPGVSRAATSVILDSAQPVP